MEEKINNKTISYHSMLDDQVLDFTNTEMDIFYTLLFFLQYSKEIKIPYLIFRDTSKTRLANKEEYSKMIEKIFNTLNETKLNENYDKLKYLNIFSELKMKNDMIIVKLNKEFDFLFDSNYKKTTTSIQLDDLLSVNSKYGKILYKLLYKYKDTGWYRIKEKELHRLMNYPKSYTSSKKNWYIKRTIDEISSTIKVKYSLKTNVLGQKYYDFKIKQ